MKKYLIMTLVVAQGTTSMAQLNKENLNLSFYRDNAVNLTSYSYTSSPTMAVQVAYDSIVKLMDLWEYKNMRIYPIVGNEVYSEESKVKNNYVSLKEALEKQTIEQFEDELEEDLIGFDLENILDSNEFEAYEDIDLSKMMGKALENENYEYAASIRDELDRRKKKD